MKVVVWNMAHKSRNWEWIQGSSDSRDADVSILCEAAPPGDSDLTILTHGSTLGRDGYPRAWSTAIASRHSLRRITDAAARRYGRTLNLPFVNSRPGSWEAAVLTLDKQDISVVSLYGLLDEKGDASVHRALSELAPLFEDPRYNERLLLGGDLNILANPRSRDPARDRHLLVLDRLEAYGLTDCLKKGRPPGVLENCPCGLGEGCTHTWTKLDPKRPSTPYQDDYLFASRWMADRLTSCKALGFTDASDHAPIVATFDIQR